MNFPSTVYTYHLRNSWQISINVGIGGVYTQGFGENLILNALLQHFRVCNKVWNLTYKVFSDSANSATDRCIDLMRVELIYETAVWRIFLYYEYVRKWKKFYHCCVDSFTTHNFLIMRQEISSIKSGYMDIKFVKYPQKKRNMNLQNMLFSRVN
jgi:hypothetical protein